MSDRQCNYCLHRERLRQAKASGQKVTTKAKPLGTGTFAGGVDVFVDGKWVCWYGALPEKCAC
jgi:hypothetical protein